MMDQPIFHQASFDFGEEPGLFDGDQYQDQYNSVRIDRSRDSLLTAFGKATLADRYLLPGDSYQDRLSLIHI